MVSIRGGTLITGGWLNDGVHSNSALLNPRGLPLVTDGRLNEDDGAHIRLPDVCLADRYIKDSSNGVFTVFPEAKLDALKVCMNGSAEGKTRY